MHDELRAVSHCAAAQQIVEYDERFEIVSMVGTLSKDGCHIHVSLADKDGKVVGGHLLSGAAPLQ